MNKLEIRKAVREGYGKIAREESSCYTPRSSCCSGAKIADDIGKKIGYSEEELKSVPEGANLGLGCGNPVALASLKPGETVLDLGSGAGFDCLLAAGRVGPSGRVIGIDMTPEMLDRARRNAESAGCNNVEFRLGEIENLPAADASVDAVISNCVINLSLDKKRVFAETFRVLKPGGRLMVSDIVLAAELPRTLRDSIESYVGCIGGAMIREEYLKTIEEAGFRNVKVVEEASFPLVALINDPAAVAIIDKLQMPRDELRAIAGSAMSAKIQAVKPKRKPAGLKTAG